MALDANGYTPTEAKIMRLLSDGYPHRPDELRTCLVDAPDAQQLKDQGESATVKMHVSNLRKKLRIHGQDVMSQNLETGLNYRLVRMTASHARA